MSQFCNIAYTCMVVFQKHENKNDFLVVKEITELQKQKLLTTFEIRQIIEVL